MRIDCDRVSWPLPLHGAIVQFLWCQDATLAGLLPPAFTLMQRFGDVERQTCAKSHRIRALLYVNYHAAKDGRSTSDPSSTLAVGAGEL